MSREPDPLFRELAVFVANTSIRETSTLQTARYCTIDAIGTRWKRKKREREREEILDFSILAGLYARTRERERVVPLWSVVGLCGGE